MAVPENLPPEVIHMQWHGPYSWTGRTCTSMYECELAEKQGIYLWTVPVNGLSLVYYVGQTGTAFARRQFEHLCAYGTGSYTILDPSALARGEKRAVYEGYTYRRPFWRNGREFVEHAGNLYPVIVELMEVIQFWFSPISTDRRTRERIEGAIIQYLEGVREPGAHLQDEGMHRVLRDPATEPPIQIEFEDVSMFKTMPKTIEA